jgi:hypothetical protein
LGKNLHQGSYFWTEQGWIGVFFDPLLSLSWVFVSIKTIIAAKDKERHSICSWTTGNTMNYIDGYQALNLGHCVSKQNMAGLRHFDL